ncbi:MAG: hypothetical protein WCG09_01405 [Halobacteriota archaeon]
MKHKRMTISIVLATLMLVSLFAVVSSAASVSDQASGTTGAVNLVGQTMTGTGPAASMMLPGYGPFLFAVDTSGHLWCTLTSGWESLGGSATSSPAATTRNNYALTVFVRGTDGAIWYRDYVANASDMTSGTWGKWTSIGGQVAAGTGPAACSWSAGRLDVFVQGTDGQLWHKWYTGTSWSGWESLGGKLTASPGASAAASSQPVTNQIGVFVRGTNGACWYKEWTGTVWSNWKSLGGQLTPKTGPGVMGAGVNTTSDVAGYEVFVQGTDNQLWWQQFSEAGSAWRSLPACPDVLSVSSPAVSWSYTGHTEVYVSSTSGNILECYASTSGWEWFSQTSPP